MSTFKPMANLRAVPLAPFLMTGFGWGGPPLKPSKNLRAVPLPPFGLGGIPTTPHGGFAMFPVKPLPGGGTGGGTVGYGI